MSAREKHPMSVVVVMSPLKWDILAKRVERQCHQQMWQAQLYCSAKGHLLYRWHRVVPQGTIFSKFSQNFIYLQTCFLLLFHLLLNISKFYFSYDVTNHQKVSNMKF